MDKFIIFSGIDGSGKSTHAHSLAYKLKLNGKSVKYVWMRGYGRALFSFPILGLCRALKITKVKTLKSGIKVSEYRFYAYKPIRLLWPWIQFVDSLFYNFILLYRPLCRSYDVNIIDRSVIDTLVDIIVDTHAPIHSRIHRLMLALLPKNSLIVVLDINENIALSRKSDTYLHYLRPRRRIYKYLAEMYGWYVLSTGYEFKKTHDQLVKLIEKEFK